MIQIDTDEWWFKGCFIQKQDHPRLKPFHVFQDTIEQATVGTCYTMTEAQVIASMYEVKDYVLGWEQFVY